MGGVGFVGTLPDYRNRGYSTATILDAIDYMAHQGYELSMLFTGIQTFYMRCGWACFPQTTFTLEFAGKKQFPPSPWIPRRFELERDLTQIIHIYDEYNRQRTETAVRTEQYWRDEYSRRIGILPSLVVEKDGTIGAYANFYSGSFETPNAVDPFLESYYPNLREVGYRSEYPDSLLALCQAILQQAYDQDVPSISGRLPRHHPLTELLSEESGSPLSFSIKEGAMYRVISLYGLFQQMIPEFLARLESSNMVGKSGSFCFVLPDRVCTLEIKPGDIVLKGDDSGQAKVSITNRSFIKVLFGDVTFSQLAEMNRIRGCSLKDGELALLDALFPKGEPMHWVCDYF